MNTKRFIMAAVAAFVSIFAIDFLVHGLLLKDMYTATSEIWRPEGEQKIGFMILSQLTFSFVITYIFIQNYENKGTNEGVRFGLCLGLLLATLDIGMYSYLPVPLTLIVCWVISSIARGLLAGTVLSLIYKK